MSDELSMEQIKDLEIWATGARLSFRHSQLIRRLCLEALARKGAAATLQPGEGWKMVPVEPTEEMQIAGFQAWEATCFRSDVSQGDDIYKAMLAASPAIQEQKP